MGPGLYLSMLWRIMGKGDSEERLQAGWLMASTTPNLSEALAFTLTPKYKRIVLTALGLRHQGQRRAFFAAARKLNVDPGFPHLFLRAVLDH